MVAVTVSLLTVLIVLGCIALVLFIVNHLR